MPVYSFQNNVTGEIKDEIMSYDDKLKYLEDNPHLQSYYSKVNVDYDGGKTVLGRAGDGWKEVQYLDLRRSFLKS